MTDRFLTVLCEASLRIPPPCFKLPIAGAGESIYRERVYSYELYHQLRILLDADEQGFGAYSLNGELDKGGHPIILKRRAPDLLFHIPGSKAKRANLVAIEIKPITALPKGIAKDIESLRYFLSEEVGYLRGVHLVYGDDEGKFRTFQRKHREADDKRLVLLWHRRTGERATVV